MFFGLRIPTRLDRPLRPPEETAGDIFLDIWAQDLKIEKIFIHNREYLFIMNKTLRQRAVLDVLKHGSVASQEDLQRHLRRRGFKVGQATLSRDIRDLNLSKTSQGYSLPHGDNGMGIALPPVSRLVREFVLDVRSAQNLLVVKTIVGSAQPVAAALDETDWPELVGTLAGDDTILIVCPDKDEARGLADRIQEMLS